MAYLLWGSLSMIATVTAAVLALAGASDAHVIETLLLAIVFALWTLQPRRSP